MMRRSFLKLAGGGMVMAAMGAGGWAATRDPAAARSPWTLAGEKRSDPRLHALSYALLAPNPHNRQPWIADLGIADEVTLTCDLNRLLPHTDPFDRQITIGLGCFIELAVMAAAQNGYVATVTLFPDGDPQPRLESRPIARLHFAEATDVRRDSLFAHVLDRRSNKEVYDDGRAVSAETLAVIARSAGASRIGYTHNPTDVAKLRKLAWTAMETELNTSRTLKESIDLLRIGRAAIEANPDGIALQGPLVEALSLTGLLSRDRLLDPSSTAFREQLAELRPQFSTAMAFLWVTTRGNSRMDQIAAGRDYVRLNLAATGLGVSMQPSYSCRGWLKGEMRPHYAQIRRMLGIEDETLQMFARLGYGREVNGAPRWPLESRIRLDDG